MVVLLRAARAELLADDAEQDVDQTLLVDHGKMGPQTTQKGLVGQPWARGGTEVRRGRMWFLQVEPIGDAPDTIVSAVKAPPRLLWDAPMPLDML